MYFLAVDLQINQGVMKEIVLVEGKLGEVIFPKYQLSTNWTFDTLLAMQKVFVKVKRSEENWAFLANAAAQPYPGIILIERTK